MSDLDFYWDKYTINLLPGEVDKLRKYLSTLMNDYELYKHLPDEELLQVFVRHQLLEVERQFHYFIAELKTGTAKPYSLTTVGRQYVCSNDSL